MSAAVLQLELLEEWRSDIFVACHTLKRTHTHTHTLTQKHRCRAKVRHESYFIGITLPATGPLAYGLFMSVEWKCWFNDEHQHLGGVNTLKVI